MFEGLPYYSLENLDIRNFAAKDPVAFLNQDAQGMALDEVQNVPALLSYIQGIVDEDPSKRFVLSGSPQFSMLKTITQSLSGRTAIFELLPLCYTEVKAQTDKKSLDELLFDGFYPAIYAEKNIASYLYPNYVKTYLERDVRDLLQVKDMMQFQTFLRLCAGRTGNLFNASELSNIENPQQLSRDKKRGDLFENFIVSDALKQQYNKGKESNLFFYRDSHQNEVDLMLRYGDQFDAVEIKSAQTYNTDFEKGLKVVDKVFEGKIKSKTIVYVGKFENTAGDIKLMNYKGVDKIIPV